MPQVGEAVRQAAHAHNNAAHHVHQNGAHTQDKKLVPIDVPSPGKISLTLYNILLKIVQSAVCAFPEST